MTALKIALTIVLASIATGITLIIMGCSFFIQKTISITPKIKNNETQKNKTQKHLHNQQGRNTPLTDTPTLFPNSEIKNTN